MTLMQPDCALQANWRTTQLQCSQIPKDKASVDVSGCHRRPLAPKISSELFRKLTGLTKLQEPSVPVCDGLLPGIFRLKQPFASLGWVAIRQRGACCAPTSRPCLSSSPLLRPACS